MASLLFKNGLVVLDSVDAPTVTATKTYKFTGNLGGVSSPVLVSTYGTAYDIQQVVRFVDADFLVTYPGSTTSPNGIGQPTETVTGRTDAARTLTYLPENATNVFNPAIHVRLEVIERVQVGPGANDFVNYKFKPRLIKIA